MTLVLAGSTLILSFLLAASITGAAILFVRRERQWIGREEKWRERERALVDKLLKQGNLSPIEIQRERVVKLPDPEIQPASFIDEAFFTDDVKEILEQQYPEAARMSHTEAQQRYAKDWQRIAKKLREEATPMRVS